MTSIAAWIDGAAARWSGAAYLEDAHGPRTVTYAGLRRCTRAWQRRLDDAGVPPGARVGVRLADPLDYATALVSLLGAGRVAVVRAFDTYSAAALLRALPSLGQRSIS